MTATRASSMDAPLAAPSVQDVTAVLAAGDGGQRGHRRMWIVLVAFVAALGVMGAMLVWRARPTAEEPAFITEPVRRDTLVVKVSATGNLEPTNQVDVGSELSGIVERVLVEENDRVARGQVLAQLDVRRLRDAVARSRAGLDAAWAQVLQAQATVAETRAVLSRFEQVRALSGGKVPSGNEMTIAEANLARAEANAASAEAAVAQARAALQTDETNVERASLRSPVDGVVLSRTVDPGQTVAASFQAPVLFTIAEDLQKMELHVDVDEADVGEVRPGQEATFTVDAWPTRRYRAIITRVGYGAQEKDGVVSYRAVLEVENEDLSLRPGMTGTAEIVTLIHDGALLVPNAALRFSPPAPGTEHKPSGGFMGRLMPRMPRQTHPQHEALEGPPRVWIVRDGAPVLVELTTGATDGQVTEVLGGPLVEGAAVIIDVVKPGAEGP